MDKAYMIRNDGKAFPILQHIYGNPDIEFIDETLAAAEWLYKHTNNSTTKNLIIEFIAAYGNSLEGHGDIIDKIINDIEIKPYKFISRDFIIDNKEVISNIKNYRDLKDLNILICSELNQEFLRARYGGIYNTFSSSREMVFRVSSVDFNWFNIIYEFVYKYKNNIDNVTIVRDEESTGLSDYYYKHNSEVFDNMPINEFIEIHGNPIIESENIKFDNIRLNLNKGKSLLESFINMNIIRICSRFSAMCCKETSTEYIKLNKESTIND